MKPARHFVTAPGPQRRTPLALEREASSQGVSTAAAPYRPLGPIHDTLGPPQGPHWTTRGPSEHPQAPLMDKRSDPKDPKECPHMVPRPPARTCMGPRENWEDCQGLKRRIRADPREPLRKMEAHLAIWRLIPRDVSRPGTLREPVQLDK